MGVLACVLIFVVTIPSWIQMPWNSCHSPHRRPHAIFTIIMGEKSHSTSYLGTIVKSLGNGLASAYPHCKYIKLFKPPSMSNTWHKRQNSINVEFLLSVSILTVFISYKEKEIHRTKWLTKAPWYYKHTSWNKNMTVHRVEWKFTLNPGSEWLRKIQGADQPTFISRIGLKMSGVFLPCRIHQCYLN